MSYYYKKISQKENEINSFFHSLRHMNKTQFFTISELREKRNILLSSLNDMPRYVRSYESGLFRFYTDTISNELCFFGYCVDGVVYSAHKKDEIHAPNYRTLTNGHVSEIQHLLTSETSGIFYKSNMKQFR